MLIGYHASHEQFAPSALLDYARLATQAGFDAIKSSDHFHPWSERQGQSGFAWAWLGAAMAGNDLPFGIVSAPGYRYHPAVLAQAAATVAEMHGPRLWVALGSGEAINEAITGEAWPDKGERNARLRECAEVMRALLAGETVTHRGRVTVVEARLFTLPATPVPLFGAAISAATARLHGAWADGLLTTGGRLEDVRLVVEAFREAGGEDKPVHLQQAVSWAPTDDEAMAAAREQWAGAAVGGNLLYDLRRPADFDHAGSSVSDETLGKAVLVTADPGRVMARIEELATLAPATVHLHQVGRNQAAFIERFGPLVANLRAAA